MFPNWEGRTVVCIASGPSLTVADCELVRDSGLVPTIVTNNTYEMCPWADAVFGADLPWWTWEMKKLDVMFGGLRICDHKRNGTLNANDHPRYRSFTISGACATAFAVACGAERVVLLGHDCQQTGGRWHHHADHPPGRNCATIAKWPAHFADLKAWAKVPIINASRVSALTCFPRVALEDALADVLLPA